MKKTILIGVVSIALIIGFLIIVPKYYRYSDQYSNVEIRDITYLDSENQEVQSKVNLILSYLKVGNVQELKKLLNNNSLSGERIDQIDKDILLTINYFSDYQSDVEGTQNINVVNDNSLGLNSAVVFRGEFKGKTGAIKKYSIILEKTGKSIYLDSIIPGETNLIAANKDAPSVLVSHDNSRKQLKVKNENKSELKTVSGFITQKLVEINGSVLMPNGWYFRHEEKTGVQSYYVSKEQILKEEDQFKTGLTLTRIEPNMQSGATAVDTAKIVIAKLKSTAKTATTSEEVSGDFKVYVINKLMEDPDYDYRMLTKVFANTKTNMVYVVTFESPDTNWNSEWNNYGKKLLDNLILDKNI